MTLNYLLDTNVISEPLRAEPSNSILEKIRLYQEEVCIATIVWHELLFGCFRLPESERRIAIEKYLFEVVAPTIPILPYDERAAHWHAMERARLMSTGKMPPFVDGQIAAIARVNDLVLVTFNIQDFEHFKEIRIEDWRDSDGQFTPT